jgi:hypothetical protein
VRNTGWVYVSEAQRSQAGCGGILMGQYLWTAVLVVRNGTDGTNNSLSVTKPLTQGLSPKGGGIRGGTNFVGAVH